MANDVSDTVRNALGQVMREALKSVGDVPTPSKKKAGPLSGARGLAAGAGLAALAPLAAKGLSRANGAGIASKAASKAGDRISSSVKDVASKKVEEAGGAGGLAKQAASGLLPGGGGDDDDGGKGGMPGVGKGRRMPIQQSVDVAVPLETAYNQWTQYEDWPQFMHRVTRVTQDDPNEVSFATKIWGKTKEFKAEIVTQRPDDRVKWRVSEGITHTGVVSFHELAPRLTRIELDLDVDPGSLIEKAARGMRHIKRAVRADLHRFKAFIEMQEHETGAWRGRIEDGEVVEEHDSSYDKQREYSELEDIWDFSGDESDDDSDDESGESDGNGQPAQAERRQRFQRQAESSRSGGAKSGSSSRSRGSSSGSKSSPSKSSGSKSGSSRSSSSKSSGTKKPAASSRSRSGTSRASKASKSSSGSGSSTRRKTASRS
jgi:uncharacterized membrane protein